MEAPLWTVMLKNTLLSAMAGVLFGCALFPLFNVVRKSIENAGSAHFDVVYLIDATLSSFLLILLIWPLVLPLVFIACLMSIVFQKSIQKRLGFWCCIAPFTVWLFVIGVLTKSAGNSYYTRFNWFERFIMHIPNPDHYLFLLAPAFSAVIFYKLSAKDKVNGRAD